MALDHDEVMKLDGGTLVLDGRESPSVVLQLAPWPAWSMTRVLEEWSSVSWIFHHPARPHLDELDLSRTLELAVSALGDGDEPILRPPRGPRAIPTGNAWPRLPGGNNALHRLDPAPSSAPRHDFIEAAPTLPGDVPDQAASSFTSPLRRQRNGRSFTSIWKQQRLVAHMQYSYS